MLIVKQGHPISTKRATFRDRLATSGGSTPAPRLSLEMGHGPLVWPLEWEHDGKMMGKPSSKAQNSVSVWPPGLSKAPLMALRPRKTCGCCLEQVMWCVETRVSLRGSHGLFSSHSHIHPYHLMKILPSGNLT